MCMRGDTRAHLPFTLPYHTVLYQAMPQVAMARHSTTPRHAMHTSIHMYRHISVHTGILAYRRTYGQIDIQTCRHTEVQTYRHMGIQTCRHTDIPTCRHTDIQKYGHTDIRTYGHTDIQTERQTDDRPTDARTDRQTDRRTQQYVDTCILAYLHAYVHTSTYVCRCTFVHTLNAMLCHIM